MTIRWTTEATGNLEYILRRIGEDKPEAALKTVRRIFEQVKSLSSFPNRGRAGHEEGTRELVLSPLPYFIAYRVREDSVEILYIQHGAQQRN
jgi:plasmid stabilization system protein ParE